MIVHNTTEFVYCKRVSTLMKYLTLEGNWTSGNVCYIMGFTLTEFSYNFKANLWSYLVVFFMYLLGKVYAQRFREVKHWLKQYITAKAIPASGWFILCTCCLEKCLSFFAIIGLECLAGLQKFSPSLLSLLTLPTLMSEQPKPYIVLQYITKTGIKERH